MKSTPSSAVLQVCISLIFLIAISTVAYAETAEFFYYQEGEYEEDWFQGFEEEPYEEISKEEDHLLIHAYGEAEGGDHGTGSWVTEVDLTGIEEVTIDWEHEGDGRNEEESYFAITTDYGDGIPYGTRDDLDDEPQVEVGIFRDGDEFEDRLEETLDTQNLEGEYYLKIQQWGGDHHQQSEESILRTYNVWGEGELVFEDPEVETHEATEVGSSSATLHGELVDLGDLEEADLYFYWREEDEEEWEEELVEEGVDVDGYSYDEELTGLDEGTTYDFYAYAEGEADEETLSDGGDELSFTTETIDPPELDTLPAEDVTHDSATLRGDLTDLGSAEEVDVYFQWREDGDEDWTDTEDETLEEPDEFDYELDGVLDPETDYEFRAYGEGDEDEQGDILEFTTGFHEAVTQGLVAADTTEDLYSGERVRLQDVGFFESTSEGFALTSVQEQIVGAAEDFGTRAGLMRDSFQEIGTVTHESPITLFDTVTDQFVGVVDEIEGRLGTVREGFQDIGVYDDPSIGLRLQEASEQVVGLQSYFEDSLNLFRHAVQKIDISKRAIMPEDMVILFQDIGVQLERYTEIDVLRDEVQNVGFFDQIDDILLVEESFEQEFGVFDNIESIFRPGQVQEQFAGLVGEIDSRVDLTREMAQNIDVSRALFDTLDLGRLGEQLIATDSFVESRVHQFRERFQDMGFQWDYSENIRFGETEDERFGIVDVVDTTLGLFRTVFQRSDIFSTVSTTDWLVADWSIIKPDELPDGSWMSDPTEVEGLEETEENHLVLSDDEGELFEGYEFLENVHFHESEDPWVIDREQTGGTTQHVSDEQYQEGGSIETWVADESTEEAYVTQSFEEFTSDDIEGELDFSAAYTLGDVEHQEPEEFTIEFEIRDGGTWEELYSETYIEPEEFDTWEEVEETYTPDGEVDSVRARILLEATDHPSQPTDVWTYVDALSLTGDYWEEGEAHDEGHRISRYYETGIEEVGESGISWDSVEPDGTDVDIYTAVTEEDNPPEDWGDPVVEGEGFVEERTNLTGRYLWFKQELTSDGEESPTLEGQTAWINEYETREFHEDLSQELVAHDTTEDAFSVERFSLQDMGFVESLTDRYAAWQDFGQDVGIVESFGDRIGLLHENIQNIATTFDTLETLNLEVTREQITEFIGDLREEVGLDIELDQEIPVFYETQQFFRSEQTLGQELGLTEDLAYRTHFLREGLADFGVSDDSTGLFGSLVSMEENIGISQRLERRIGTFVELEQQVDSFREVGEIARLDRTREQVAGFAESMEEGVTLVRSRFQDLVGLADTFDLISLDQLNEETVGLSDEFDATGNFIREGFQDLSVWEEVQESARYGEIEAQFVEAIYEIEDRISMLQRVSQDLGISFDILLDPPRVRELITQTVGIDDTFDSTAGLFRDRVGVGNGVV